MSVERPSLQAQPMVLQLYSQVFRAQNTQKGRVPISAAQLEAAVAICLHTDDVHFDRLVKGCVTASPPPPAGNSSVCRWCVTCGKML